MVNWLTILSLGFFLGMRHATDADHVVAVTTLVSRERNVLRAGSLGLLWGLGHTLTIFLAGTAIILLRLTVPRRVELGMELVVAFMLIALGAANLRGAFAQHAHSHDGDHDHDHGHGGESHVDGRNIDLDDVDGDEHDRDFVRGQAAGMRKTMPVWLRPLLVGTVHGLAGSAAIALLVLTTIRTPMLSIAYLLLFGLGTIAGMMLITSAIAMPIVYSRRRVQGLGRRLRIGAGALSLLFGLVLAWQLGRALL
jgi:hypothetical protein